MVMLAGAALLVLYFSRPYENSYEGAPVVARDKKLPEFQLINQHNEIFRLDSLKGKPIILFFGYTSCPDVCPLAMRKIKQALERIHITSDEVGVVFVTVDPWRDTPQTLSDWVDRSYPETIALTGEFEDLAAVWRLYGAAIPEDVWKARNSTGEYYISHSAVIYVADSDHILRYILSPEMSVETFKEAIGSVVGN